MTSPHTPLRNNWGLSPATPEVVDLRRPAMPERTVEVAAEPQHLVLDLSRTALVVVDVQNDFCHPDGWLAGIGVDLTPAAAVVPLLVDLLPEVRAAGVPVVWVNWGQRPDAANLPPGVRHVYDPVGAAAQPLQAGSWGAAVVDELTREPGDISVDKHRMSGFPDTELDSVLRNLRVDTLVFAGVNSDQCVYATLIDAANLGYDVIMLRDASATTSPAYCHDATVYNVRQCFGFTTTTPHLRSALAWIG